MKKKKKVLLACRGRKGTTRDSRSFGYWGQEITGRRMQQNNKSTEGRHPVRP